MYLTYILFDRTKEYKKEFSTFCSLFEPFYVGKGKISRIFSHFREYKQLKHVVYNKLKDDRIKSLELLGYGPIDISSFILETKDEKEAFDHEIKLILEIGRLDFSSGPLLNLTNGGPGFIGPQGRKTKGKTYEEIYGPEEAKRLKDLRRKNSHLNTPILKEQLRARIKGKSFETAYGEERASLIKKKISIGHTGKHFSRSPTNNTKGKTYEQIYGKDVAENLKEIRRKRFLSNHPTAKTWEVVDPHGVTHILHNNISQFFKDKGISHQAMQSLANGSVKKDNHRGWKARYL